MGIKNQKRKPNLLRRAKGSGGGTISGLLGEGLRLGLGEDPVLKRLGGGAVGMTDNQAKIPLEKNHRNVSFSTTAWGKRS